MRIILFKDAYQCWLFNFALPLIGAKKLEKNRGAKIFDLNSAIFWGNEFLSCAHPRSSKKNDFFYFSRYLKTENANRFLSSRRLIWAIGEPDWTKNKEVSPREKLSVFSYRQKIWHFSVLEKVPIFLLSL